MPRLVILALRLELKEVYMSYNSTDAGISLVAVYIEHGFNKYSPFLLFGQPVSISLRIKKKRQGFKLSGTYTKTYAFIFPFAFSSFGTHPYFLKISLSNHSRYSLRPQSAHLHK